MYYKAFVIAVYFIRSNKKMFLLLMKAHSPKFSLTGILNALFLVVSDILQSRSGSAFPPLSPKLHSPVQKKGGWAVGLPLCQA